jgi:hypothetical protein
MLQATRAQLPTRRYSELLQATQAAGVELGQRYHDFNALGSWVHVASRLAREASMVDWQAVC